MSEPLQPPLTSTPRMTWEMIRLRPWPFLLYASSEMTFFVLPLAYGLIQKRIFDQISGSAAAA